MTDFLHITLMHQEILSTGALALAHVGDAVYELMVRAYLCKNGGQSAKTLHRKTVAMVSANAQAQALERIIDILSDEEREIYNRGRNTKVNSHPKGTELSVYHAATGLEVLFGSLYLSGEYDRLNFIFSHIIENENGFSD